MATIVHLPKDGHTHSFIMLHGLGANGDDFAPLIKIFDLPGLAWILPTAPTRPVTINHGLPCNSWYDITNIDTRNSARDFSFSELQESVQDIADLIQVEHEKGIPYANIYLGGFSQGGAVAYHTALLFPKTLGGLVAVSTYVPGADDLERAFSGHAIGMPVLLLHGKEDTTVPVEMGEQSVAFLQRLGISVQAEYDDEAGHEVSPFMLKLWMDFVRTQMKL